MAMYGRPAGDESDSDEEMMFYSHETKDSKMEKEVENSDATLMNDTVSKEETKQLEASYPPEKLEELRIAIMKGNIRMVKEIIETYISVDTLLKGNWTPLLYACLCYNYEIINYLLDKGADSNFNKDLFTPLMALCASKNDDGKLEECCEKLIRSGASVNAVENHHMSPLMFASKEDHKNLVELLIKNKANINAQDNHGWPALAWAASQGYGEIVRILLENKADPTLVCVNGESIAELTRARGYNIIADVLQNIRNSDINHSLLKKLPVKEKKITDNKSTENSSSQKFKRYGDLEVFLSGLGLSHLIPIFEEQKVTFQTFLCLSDEELEKLGVEKFGERKMILNSLKNVHQKKWEESSLISFRNKNYVSCPEILAILENIAKHILYIQSTIKYLQNKISENQYSLEVGKDIVQVSCLSQQARITMENVQSLQEELKGFVLHLEKEEKKVEHQPADLIADVEIEKKPMPKYLISAGLILLAVVAVKSASLINVFR